MNSFSLMSDTQNNLYKKKMVKDNYKNIDIDVVSIPKFKFYLSHPFETHGKPSENRKLEQKIANYLEEKFPTIEVIRPFELISKEVDRETAIARSLELLKDCDGIILTGEWNRSIGCLIEKQQAWLDNKLILELHINESEL